MEVDAPIADNRIRRRDERVAVQARYQQAPDVLYNKSRSMMESTVYQPRDITYAAAARTCVCPAGKLLHPKGSAIVTNGFISAPIQGTLRDCVPCAHRAQCA